MGDEFSRREILHDLEADAEWLAAEQLDLIAQIEAQLRLVRQTMRQIEKLRRAQYRVGPELSNGQRGDALSILTDEIGTLTEQLGVQGATCRDMLATVEKMQSRLAEMILAAQKQSVNAQQAPGNQAPEA
jgi:chaperonin cofactor prefoldin